MLGMCCLCGIRNWKTKKDEQGEARKREKSVLRPPIAFNNAYHSSSGLLLGTSLLGLQDLGFPTKYLVTFNVALVRRIFSVIILQRG